MKAWRSKSRMRFGALIAMLGLSALACTPAEDLDYSEFGNPNVQPTPMISSGLTGFDLFGDKSEGGGSGIGVNSYLWRASLDTVSFMPLVSADPFGGVIITDWYTPPDTPYERFKLTVYILDTKLRVDGIKVNVFRQQLVANTDWKDAAVSTDMATKLENAILTRARQLRIKNISN